MKNYTYFTISGEFAPEELIARIGVSPAQILFAGEPLPSGEIAKKTTLVYGINGETEKPLTERMTDSISSLIPKEELLAELKTELGLTYYLTPADFQKDELLIVPFPLSRFLYISGTFRDLDYYTF